MSAPRRRAPRAPLTVAPLRWRPRALFLFGAGALLAVAAILDRSSIPLFLSLPLLLAPVAAGLTLPRAPLRARVDWIERGSGASIRVSGRITTEPTVASASLYPEFVIPEPLQERVAPELRAEDGGLRFELELVAPFPCLVDLPLPRVRWQDPLGLAESPATVEGAPLSVERFPPELQRIERANLRRTTPLPGEIRSRAVGRTGDFFALRPAHASDTVRQVNWWASARLGRLVANDFLAERTGDLILLLDVRPTPLGRARDEKLLSVSRAAALGVATAFLRQKARVGLGLYGEFLDAVPLGTGRRQRHRIVTELRDARIVNAPGPAERLAVSMRQYFPPGVLSILFSPLAEEDSLLLLPHLRRRGYPLIVVSPSPLPLLAASTKEVGAEDATALRLLKLVRRRQMAEVWREAPVVDWEEYWSLAPLVELLRRPVRRGGGIA